jgi:antirestriction protein ArdC
MAYNVKTPARDIYQEVTDRIVAALETGAAPWLRPWRDSKAGTALEPHNAVTGRPYNGINWLVLSCLPYTSTGWLTYKQAGSLGGNVRKGEKGTQIVFWKFDHKDEETGKVIPFARAYTVFNLEQCENLDPAKVQAPQPATEGQTDVNAIARRVGATVKHHGSKAFFSPSSDIVVMPTADAFKTTDHYASTLAHELTHWTGHKSRLDRDFSGRFGSEAYAFEELVAEIGSAFTCARLGIPLEGLQHADYLASWLKVLKNDKRAIFTAASKAKLASAYLLDAEDATEEENLAA